MENGRIVEQGTYDKVRNSQRFRSIYEAMMKDQKRKKSEAIDLLEDIEKEIEEPEKPV